MAEAKKTQEKQEAKPKHPSQVRSWDAKLNAAGNAAFGAGVLFSGLALTAMAVKALVGEKTESAE